MQINWDGEAVDFGDTTNYTCTSDNLFFENDRYILYLAAIIPANNQIKSITNYFHYGKETVSNIWKLSKCINAAVT